VSGLALEAQIRSKKWVYYKVIHESWVHHHHSGSRLALLKGGRSKSLMRAIRQCDRLERSVAVKQAPETLDTPETHDIRQPSFLPGHVHIFEEEIPNSLRVGRAHKAVDEKLEVLHGGW